MLLNTCSVRDMAEQKALGKMGMLGRMAKQRPDVVFGFLGCMAQARGDELAQADPAPRSRRRHAEIPSRGGLRGRAGGNEKRGRAGWMIRVFPSSMRRRKRLAGNDSRTCAATASGDGVCLDHAGLQHALHLLHRAADARRGAQPHDRARSSGKCEELVGRGVKEVTLLGQIVNLYGRHEFPESRREESLCAIARGGARSRRARASALHFAASDRFSRRSDRRLSRSAEALPSTCICRCNPVPNRILKAMHRTYTAEKYLRLVDQLRAVREDIALTTDMIVGFPGRDGGGLRKDARSGRASPVRQRVCLSLFAAKRNASGRNGRSDR